MQQENMKGISESFDNLNNIPCNTVVHLQILTPTKAIRLKTRIIGVDPNMSIILAMQNDSSWLSARNFIREGQGAIVRLISLDSPAASIIAFRTNIQKIMSIAGNWLVMDYPQKELQKAALRKYSRIPIDIECTITQRDSKNVISKGVLSDISINGCAYVGETLADSKLDSLYDLHVKQTGNESALLQTVTIKNISKDLYTSQQQYGLAFQENDKTTNEFIQKIILLQLSISTTNTLTEEDD